MVPPDAFLPFGRMQIELGYRVLDLLKVFIVVGGVGKVGGVMHGTIALPPVLTVSHSVDPPLGKAPITYIDI